MAHCSKYFFCKSPDKAGSKCTTKKTLPSELEGTRMRNCFKYTWVNQNEHVREYNWSLLNPINLYDFHVDAYYDNKYTMKGLGDGDWTF